MQNMIHKLVEIATKEIGYTEGKGNANKYSKALGRRAESWCADFVVWCFKQAGYQDKIIDTPSVIQMTKWAKSKSLEIKTSDAKPGDIVAFDFDKLGIPEHIGIVVKSYDKKTNSIETIEGNTSPKSGSQSNGDCVARKVRGLPYIYQVFRPKYQEIHETKQENQKSNKGLSISCGCKCCDHGRGTGS